VSYCNELSSIINDLQKLEAKVWQPTLVRLEQNLILGATTSVTSEAISSINMKFNADSLYKLSKYQFAVYPGLFDGHPELKFAYEYVTEVDIDTIATVAKWMRALQVQRVLLDRPLSMATAMRSEIEAAMAGMNVIPISKYDARESNREFAPRSFLLRTHSHLNTNVSSNIDKIIVLKNARPVEVK
jgi:hypothetical protein